MVPMLKTEKGWLLQVSPVQLNLIRQSCLAGRISLQEILLTVRGLTPESREETLAEIKELEGITSSINLSLKAVASAPESDFTVEVELPPQLQL